MKYIITIILLLIISFLFIVKVPSGVQFKELRDSLNIIRLQKRDTIRQIDTFVQHTETSIQPILNKIKRLENSLNNIDEKLNKDTSIINSFTIDRKDSALRARYNY